MRLPTQWRILLLTDVVEDMQQGFAQRPNSAKQGMAQLRTNNITIEGMIELSDLDYVTLPERSAGKYLLQPGDVLFNNTNSLKLVGKTALFDVEEEYTFSNHMTRIRVKPDLIETVFLANYLHFLWTQGEFQRKAKAWVSQAAIDLNTLGSLQIPLPSRVEQQYIVSILQQAREIRTKRKLAEQKARLLLVRLYEETFLRNEARTNWPVIKIEDAGKVQLGRQRSPHYQTGRYTKPYLRVANVLEDNIDLSDVLEMDFDKEDFKKYQLHSGDILLNEGQGSKHLVGRPAMWRTELLTNLPEGQREQFRNLCFQNTLIRFRANTEIVHPEYALSLFLKYLHDGTFARVSAGSDISHLGAERFAKLPFLLPPLELQEAYATKVSAVRNTLRDIGTKEAHVGSTITALFSMAFSGTLSAGWREANRDLVARSVAERDALLDDASKMQVIDQTPPARVDLNLYLIKSSSARSAQARDIRKQLENYSGMSVLLYFSDPTPEALSHFDIITRDLALRIAAPLEAETEHAIQRAEEAQEPRQLAAERLSAAQRQQAQEIIDRFINAVFRHPFGEQMKDLSIGFAMETIEQLSVLVPLAVLTPDNPAHPRAMFWQDVHKDSFVRLIYDAVRLCGGYSTAHIICNILEGLGENQVNEDEAFRTLDTLAAAGVLLNTTLEMPDPSDPNEASVFLEVFRIPDANDDGRTDFGKFADLATEVMT